MELAGKPLADAVGRVVGKDYEDDRTVEGFHARVVQHEVDHLNGVLFIDRMDKKVRAGIDAAVKELAKLTKDAAASGAS